MNYHASRLEPLRRLRLAALPLLLLVVSVALAQQPLTRPDEPSAERLRADVTYLASDQLDGRRTGTPGAEAAAKYIADEFKRLGLQPAALSGFTFVVGQPQHDEEKPGYYQSFPYIAGVDLGQSNAMTFTPKAEIGTGVVPVPTLDLRVGEDWMPLAWSANSNVPRSPVVYVGYGITASELNHDDYAGVDVQDKIALAFVGTPDGDNPHGQFARYDDLRFKAAAARDHGARALLLITRSENFKDDRRAHLQLEENAAGDAGLPVVLISRQVARRAIEAAATPAVRFEALEGALNAGEPASSTNQMSAPPAQTATAPAPSPIAPRKSFSTPLQNIAFSLTTDLKRRSAPAANVIGVLLGSDPQLRQEFIIIGAHYDHLGRGGQGSLATRAGDIHHGADDNASGVAGLLELARIFTSTPTKSRRTLVFIAFSGEEEGLLGSAYYVAHPVVPLAQTAAMINMDMIGRLQNDKLTVGGVGTSIEWKDLLARLNQPPVLNLSASTTTSAPEPCTDTGSASSTASAAGANSTNSILPAKGQAVAAANGAVLVKQRFALTLSEDGYGPSDHSSFYARQVPVLFFWTGTHEDYHKPTDTADKLNYEGESRIVAFVRDVVRALDAADKRPTYTQAKSDSAPGRSMGFRVYLGTIPSYADSTDGLKLDGVREDSPAAKAGLKAGDRVVKLAGRDVRNVYDYTYALGEMKAGQEYEVEVVRGTEHLTLKIRPTARK